MTRPLLQRLRSAALAAAGPLKWPFLALWLVLSLALLEVSVFVLVRVARVPVLVLSELAGREAFLRGLLPLCCMLAGAALGGRVKTRFPVTAFIVGGIVCAAALERGLGLYTYLYETDRAAVWMFGSGALAGALAVGGCDGWSWPRAAAWGAAAGASALLLGPAELDNLHLAGVVLYHALLPVFAPRVIRP